MFEKNRQHFFEYRLKRKLPRKGQIAALWMKAAKRKSKNK